MAENEFIELKSRIHLWEKLLYGNYLSVYYITIKLLKRVRLYKLLKRILKRKDDVYIEGQYKNILEVFEHIGIKYS